jgi:hypothetical protein
LSYEPPFFEEYSIPCATAFLRKIDITKMSIFQAFRKNFQVFLVYLYPYILANPLFAAS